MSHLLRHGRARALLALFITAQWLLVAAGAQAEDSVRLLAKVTRVVGSARYVDKNHPHWTELRAGDYLAPDSVFQTNTRDSVADIEVTGADGGGRGEVRILANTIVRGSRLSSKRSGSVEARDILLEVPVGQVRISLDGVADYTVTLIGGSSPARVLVPHNVGGPKETVFVFNGSLTVLKGAVKASIGTGPEKLVQGGEQLRRGAQEATKTPAEAPELRLGK